MCAVMEDQCRAVEMLLCAGAPIETKTMVYFQMNLNVHCIRFLTYDCSQDGSTPLVCAAYCGHLSVVEVLLLAKSDIEAKNQVHN